MQKKMELQISEDTKIQVASAVDPLKDKIFEIHTRLQKVEQVGPSNQNESGGNTEKLQKQIDEITEKIKHTDIAADPKMTSTTMVIGGLTDYSSLREASKWLSDILWEAYAPIPIETFVKTISGEFFGVFCARFASASDRIKALSVVKSKLVELGGKEVWANI